MYFAPANPSSPRLFGVTVAGIVTSAAIYAPSVSHIGFGHGATKPVDFTSTMSSEGAGGAEPKTVMVPDTSIPAASSSGSDSNQVREGNDRMATVEPAHPYPLRADETREAVRGLEQWSRGQAPRFRELAPESRGHAAQ